MTLTNLLYSPATRKNYLVVPWHVNFGEGDNQRHIHPVYHLLLFLEGSGKIERDNYERSLLGGDLLIVNPNEQHVIHANQQTGLFFYSLSFYLLAQDCVELQDGAVQLDGLTDLRKLAEKAETAPLEQLFSLTCMQNQQKCALSDRFRAKLIRLIYTYEQQFAALNPNFKRFWLDPHTSNKIEFARLTNLMLLEWLHMFELMEKSDQGTLQQDALLNKLYQSFDAFVFSRYSHAALKKQLNYNPVYLAAYFKEKTGMTPRAYIDQQKIRQACIDLHETNASVEAISLRLQYSSPGHFCANFKKEMQMTPKQYRYAARE